MCQTKVVEKTTTHFVFSNPPHRKSCRHEVMCKHMAWYRAGLTYSVIWRVFMACWITKAIHTHSEYVILIAVRLQQWLHERTSMLRFYAYPLS
jgi:hypothetical protein